jgi:hypothetical protein
VGVVRGPERQDPDALRTLVPPGATVIASSAAWDDYAVFGPPFFVLVDGRTNSVVTEGVAFGVEQVVDHVVKARRGETGPEVPRLSSQ